MSADAPTLFDSDAEKLRAQLKETEENLRLSLQEETRLRDLLHSYTTGESRRREEQDATARRIAWSDVTRASRNTMIYQCRKTFDALAETINDHECPESASLQETLASFMTELRSNTNEDQIDMTLTGEIRWLRSYIERAGRVLHKQFADPNPPVTDRCRCVGCDLIVGVDIDVQHLDGPVLDRSDLQQRVIRAENERDQSNHLLAAYKAIGTKPERY